MEYILLVKTDESLFLLATAYYRNSQINHAYNLLKEKPSATPQCKYLFGNCAFELGRSVHNHECVSFSCKMYENANNCL